MPFAKGNKLGKGRPKGSRDIKTEEWHNIGKYLTMYGSKRYVDELKKAKGREYMERFEKILEYFKPKLARTETKVGGEVDLKIITTNYANAANVSSSPISVETNGGDG